MVRGGRDMTLTNFFNFPVIETLAGNVVRMPRGQVIENYLLEFCQEYDAGAPTIDVPESVWQSHDEVIGIWAPELQHEGGVRGVRFDPPLEPGDPLPDWQPPLAPHRPSTDPYQPILEMEMDIRRRTSWGFPPLKKGLAALMRPRRASGKLID